jgi:hypothetical protein
MMWVTVLLVNFSILLRLHNICYNVSSSAGDPNVMRVDYLLDVICRSSSWTISKSTEEGRRLHAAGTINWPGDLITLPLDLFPNSKQQRWIMSGTLCGDLNEFLLQFKNTGTVTELWPLFPFLFNSIYTLCLVPFFVFTSSLFLLDFISSLPQLAWDKMLCCCLRIPEWGPRYRWRFEKGRRCWPCFG